MTRQYPWEEYYEAAILETDRSRLPALIQAAQQAIYPRIEEFRTDHGGTPEERDAIETALRGVRVLEQELL